ncbi:hypothetical protein K0M31_014329 [Melipona bicolor]|uniref:Uncharacterized protein n=1 Tax=Melipona bicolor TaxID=60889 RepID=A0AA40KU77_9HYME|nr:hypothetical protein K0M31_014329 [Melipona bicolor]
MRIAFALRDTHTRARARAHTHMTFCTRAEQYFSKAKVGAPTRKKCESFYASTMAQDDSLNLKFGLWATLEYFLLLNLYRVQYDNLQNNLDSNSSKHCLLSVFF